MEIVLNITKYQIVKPFSDMAGPLEDMGIMGVCSTVVFRFKHIQFKQDFQFKPEICFSQHFAYSTN